MKVKELYIKSKDLEQTKEDNKKLSKLGDSMNAEITSLKKANEELAHDNFAFQETTRREKAALYKELGTAYTQLKLFDMAIASYEKSLSLNPDDGEAHYNAALLYRGIREDSLRAIQHLGEAWRLTDDPKKKQDIEYMTKMLKEKSFLKEWNAGHS
jgi:tetratricopeptide (TPR) repeat protein